MKDGYFWYLRFLGCFSMWKSGALSDTSRFFAAPNSMPHPLFHAEYRWVQLDQIKKIFKKNRDYFFKVFCYFAHDGFWPKKSIEHLIKCLHSLNHGHSLSEAKFVSKQQREECLRSCFFSVANLPSLLNDWKISVPKPKPKMDIYKYHQIVTSKRIKKH